MQAATFNASAPSWYDSDRYVNLVPFPFRRTISPGWAAEQHHTTSLWNFFSMAHNERRGFVNCLLLPVPDTTRSQTELVLAYWPQPVSEQGRIDISLIPYFLIQDKSTPDGSVSIIRCAGCYETTYVHTIYSPQECEIDSTLYRNNIFDNSAAEPPVWFWDRERHKLPHSDVVQRALDMLSTYFRDKRNCDRHAIRISRLLPPPFPAYQDNFSPRIRRFDTAQCALDKLSSTVLPYFHLVKYHPPRGSERYINVETTVPTTHEQFCLLFRYLFCKNTTWHILRLLLVTARWEHTSQAIDSRFRDPFVAMVNSPSPTLSQIRNALCEPLICQRCLPRYAIAIIDDLFEAAENIPQAGHRYTIGTTQMAIFKWAYFYALSNAIIHPWVEAAFSRPLLNRALERLRSDAINNKFSALYTTALCALSNSSVFDNTRCF